MRKFKHYEIVRFTRDVPEIEVQKNEEGYILGYSVADDGELLYGVFMYNMEELVGVTEDVIESTDKFESNDTIHGAGNMSVQVNKDGEGKVVGYEDHEDPSKNW